MEGAYPAHQLAYCQRVQAVETRKLQCVIEQVVVGETSGKVRRARWPVFPAHSQVHRELLRDLPFVLKIEVVNRVTAGRKDDRQIAANLVRLVQQESCERVAKAGFRIAIQRGRPSRKLEPAARVKDLSLKQILPLAPNIEAPLDQVCRLRLGPVVHIIEIRHGTLPWQAVDKTHDGIVIAVDPDFCQTTRPVVQIHIGYANVPRCGQAVINVDRLIAIPHDAKPDLRQQCRTENMRVIEAGTLVARRPTALKAAVVRPSVNPAVWPVQAGVEYRGPLETIAYKESIFG